jgi:polysaccharide deacetylase family protein (PEP-CTERM system associated)
MKMLKHPKDAPFCAVTIDVEEWYHRNDVNIPAEVIPGTEGRVRQNVQVLLELLEKTDSKATFFVLGTVAAQFPDLVGEIVRKGHEIACHGYEHRLTQELSCMEFRENIRRAKKILEQQAGVPVIGFRAPAWSINGNVPWVWKVLYEEGFRYDSSLAAKRFAPWQSRLKTAQSYFRLPNRIVEFPPSLLRICGLEIPFGGFGFRALPLSYVERQTRRLRAKGIVPMLYLHPWDVDADFRYPAGLSWRRKALLLAKSVGMRKCREKLRRYLSAFRGCSVQECLRIELGHADSLS